MYTLIRIQCVHSYYTLAGVSMCVCVCVCVSVCVCVCALSMYKCNVHFCVGSVCVCSFNTGHDIMLCY